MAPGPVTLWQIEGGKLEVVTDFLFLGSSITVDGDSSCEIRRQWLLVRKAMTNLDSVLKSRDITLPTKVCIVKAMVVPIGRVQLWELDCKEGRMPKNWCFRTMVLEKTPESPLDCKEVKPVSQGDQPWVFIGRTDAEAEATNILATWCEQTTHWKSSWCWERSMAEGDKGIRGWDGWTASRMQWMWTWASSGRWWGTGRPGVLQSVRLQRVGQDWATEERQQEFRSCWGEHNVLGPPERWSEQGRPVFAGEEGALTCHMQVRRAFQPGGSQAWCAWGGQGGLCGREGLWSGIGRV